MPKPEEAEFVVDLIQSAMLAQHGGLRFAGGALQPDKCSWSLVDFKWVNGKHKHCTEDDLLPASFCIPGLTGMPATAERVPQGIPIGVLGFWQLADGNMKKQKEVRVKKIKAWGEVKATWCLRLVAWMAL